MLLPNRENTQKEPGVGYWRVEAVYATSVNFSRSAFSSMNLPSLYFWVSSKAFTYEAV